MIDNRRKLEASALRQLFSSQWNHVLALAAGFEELTSIDRRHPDSPPVAELSTAIETVVNGTDTRMRAIGSYKKRLRDCVRAVLVHIDSLVEDLPEAMEVNQHSFSKDPMLNSIFVNKTEMQQVFSRCPELHEFFRSPDHQEFKEAYALLFFRRHEKTILGNKMNGDMIIGDVKQVSVNFSEHSLQSPGETEQSVRQSLETLLFESIVEYIKTNLTRESYEQQQSGSKHTMDPRQSLKNPEVYLQQLVNCMQEPLDLLQRRECMLKISKLGIRLDHEDTEAANEVHLHALKVGELPPRAVALVRYPKNELLPPESLYDSL